MSGHTRGNTYENRVHRGAMNLQESKLVAASRFTLRCFATFAMAWPLATKGADGVVYTFRHKGAECFQASLVTCCGGGRNVWAS